MEYSASGLSATLMAIKSNHMMRVTVERTGLMTCLTKREMMQAGHAWSMRSADEVLAAAYRFSAMKGGVRCTEHKRNMIAEIHPTIVSTRMRVGWRGIID